MKEVFLQKIAFFAYYYLNYRRILMKKNMSTAALSLSTKIHDPLSSLNLLSCRINTEAIKSPRSTHNSNMEVIPHEQSFDQILKRFKLVDPKACLKRKVETERKGLSIHDESRSMMVRQKLFLNDSMQTERIQKNLQILKERYILLPDINLKLSKQKSKENIDVSEDCDYEKFGRTANKLKKLNKKSKKQKQNKQNKPKQQNCVTNN